MFPNRKDVSVRRPARWSVRAAACRPGSLTLATAVLQCSSDARTLLACIAHCHSKQTSAFMSQDLVQTCMEVAGEAKRSGDLYGVHASAFPTACAVWRPSAGNTAPPQPSVALSRLPTGFPACL